MKAAGPARGIFAEALRVTLLRPREGARLVLGWGLGQREVGLALFAGIAVALLDTALLDIAARAGKATDEAVPAAGVLSLAGLLVQAGEIAVVALLAIWVGRAFGGTGSALQVTAAVAWVNVAQNLLILPLAAGAALLGPAFLALAVLTQFWLLWVLACFIAEAHGFPSAGRVFAAMIGFAVTLGLAIAVLLIALGYEPPEIR
jgi:Yip1 domain